MTENAELAKLLEDLGEALEKASWQPELPFGNLLDGEETPTGRRRSRALLFLTENKERIRSVICKDGRVRHDLEIGASVAIHVSSLFAAQTWAEAHYAGPLADVVCKLGLDKICRNKSPR